MSEEQTKNKKIEKTAQAIADMLKEIEKEIIKIIE